MFVKLLDIPMKELVQSTNNGITNTFIVFHSFLPWTAITAQKVKQICILDSQQKLSFQLPLEEQIEMLTSVGLTILSRSSEVYKPRAETAKPPRYLKPNWFFFPASKSKCFCDSEGATIKAKLVEYN